MTWTRLIRVFTANSGVELTPNNNLRVVWYLMDILCQVDERYVHMQQFSPTLKNFNLSIQVLPLPQAIKHVTRFSIVSMDEFNP